MAETKPKKWYRLRIEYEDGGIRSLEREDLEKLEVIIPILESLQRAKDMRDRLNLLLGGD